MATRDRLLAAWRAYRGAVVDASHAWSTLAADERAAASARIDAARAEVLAAEDDCALPFTVGRRDEAVEEEASARAPRWGAGQN